MNETTERPDTTGRRFHLAYVAIGLAVAWLAYIALLKMFAGNPMDLPKPVLGRSPFAPDVTFVVAVSIELAVAVFAITKPRWGWIPLAALFVVFEAVLSSLIAAGEKSCGCAGGALTIKPAVMAAIDGALLLFVLASRPWTIRGRGMPWWIPALGLVVAGVAPKLEYDARTTGPNADTVSYDPHAWKGQLIFDVKQLTDHLKPEDVDKLPTDGLVVLWRQSCEHCAEHLRVLAGDAKRNDGSRPIVLVQIQDDLDLDPQVHVMPEGSHVTRIAMKVGPRFAMPTPWELVVEGGTITKVLDEAESKAEQAAGG